MSVKDFDGLFRVLADVKEPFPWQRALYEKFAAGEFPASCKLPTGLGKTLIIAVWLLALAANPKKVPRRLVYIVNRRTIVDQATDEAKRIRERLSKHQLKELWAALEDLCAAPADIPLAISTLRGQFEDNAEWRNDPARPAIVVGTVDMIGSRLLFSGYGAGFKSRPFHAGLLGYDTLIVHDEAHLEPAFQELLKRISKTQGKRPTLRPFHVLELTATSRGNEEEREQFELTPDDYKDRTVRDRIEAKKGIAFHPVDSEKAIASRIAELALEYKDSQQAILVFAKTINDVEIVAEKLGKAKQSVQLLTGTIRGHERDQLAESGRVFARFLPSTNRPSGIVPEEGTVYLICTSAGEVGVNISADHLICDLTTFESMAQRFGRVNRFGKGDARIDIVHPANFGDQNDYELSQRRTLELLRQLKPRVDGRLDASPRSLDELPLDQRDAAYSPTPEIPYVDEILFDAWSLTTIKDEIPGRPPIAPWLHGTGERVAPETFVGWRDEVETLSRENLVGIGSSTFEEFAADLLDEYPLKPHELLRDREDRVFAQLETLAERHRSFPAWVVEPNDMVRAITLQQLVEKDRQKRPIHDLANRIVLLPPNAGGLRLDQGLLDGKAGFVEDRRTDYDIADKWFDANNRQRRARVWDGDELPDGFEKVPCVWEASVQPRADDAAEGDEDQSVRVRRFYVRPRSADGDSGSWSAKEEQELAPHLALARTFAERIGDNLLLEEPLRTAVILASLWHDKGKARALWQYAMRNREYPAKVLAKSGNSQRPGDLSHYRHEFGSLLDVMKATECTNELDKSEELKDLVLHLIAAHHGRARPCFPPEEAFDPQHRESAWNELAIETPQRFARLQRQYGRWGLAWLESLVRAADILASQPTQEKSQ